MDYLNNLNPEQKKAVQHLEGPMMVIAGAGSGKTRVLTSRIIHLLNNNIYDHNILSLTFTNKAAKEMRERINNSFARDKTKNIWMGTFHSIFARILRMEANQINYPTNFTIYDTEDCKNLVKSIIKDKNLDKEIYKTNLIRNRISFLKNNFITSESYKEHLDLQEADKIAKRTEFASIYKTYESKCRKSSAMDFDDLLLKTYELLCNNKDTLFKYQNKFKYILIDEYQDTNHIQYLIIKKLADFHKNICVVGDDAQSIYSFRGATIKNILNFKLDYPKFTTYKLEQNYRSSKNIVQAANSIIKHNERQIQKNIWTENNEGDKIIITKVNTDKEESLLVSNTIKHIKQLTDAHNKDFAILYRTNAQSRSLEEALRKNNIAYKIYGGISFYQRKEIKDILAYCRVLVNQKDEEALKRIINYPVRGIGINSIQKLISYANEQNTNLWNVICNIDSIKLFNKGTKNRIIKFKQLIIYFLEQSKILNAFEIVNEIIKKTGIYELSILDKTPEGISRFENVQELLNGLQDFSENNLLNSLSEFVNEVALITDQDNDNTNIRNSVTLMTVHAAKGLEFQNVFIVGLEENLFPSMLSLQNIEDIEEERRLFYVAITRAEKRLFISFTSNRFKWGQFINCEPSRFIYEIDEKYTEKKEAKNKELFQKNIYLKTKNSDNKQINKIKLKRLPRFLSSKEENNNLIKFKVGSKVKHIKFGEGEIISLEEDGVNKKAIISFKMFGVKKLLLRFAKLQLL